jgi:mono/diheme cytochrome c family protein
MQAAWIVLAASLLPQAQEPPSYGKVHDVFRRNCVGCHDAKEQKGALILETYEALVRGGENGPVFVPGKPDESAIVKSVEFKAKPHMPPPKKGERLRPEEIAAIRAWIAAGAPAPKPGEVSNRPIVPRIRPKAAPRRPIFAAAYEPRAKLLALARAGEVEIVSAETRAAVRTLAGHAGNVNDLAFSADGSRLAAAAGEPGVGGEVLLWSVADGKLLRAFRSHKDAVYAVALSPDGKILASAGYDTRIELRDAGSDALLRTLDGHNEAVFDLAFRPDGKILASASADRTVKLWDAASGQRRDTLGESTKALNAVAWSRDGGRVAAGGVDNRIRVWRVGADAAEGTNDLVHSTFAHEGSILRLAISPDGKTLLSSADDRTVKLWNFAEMAPQKVLEAQPDWPSAIAFAGTAVAVGRLDGTWGLYEAATGNAVLPPKPELNALEPRGVQRGTSSRVKLAGKNLAPLAAVKAASLKVEAQLAEGGGAASAWVTLSVAPDAEPGPVEIWVAGAGGESGRLTVHVDDLPQRLESEPNDAPSSASSAPLPASLWGAFSARGDADHYSFEGKAGQTIVLDVAARRLGSKAEAVVTLSDAGGRVLASNVDFEGEADPLLVHALPADGCYSVRVSDLQMAASGDHFYRLSIGTLPLVTGCSPLSVPAHRETRVALAGHNLPAGASVAVKAGGPGEIALPLESGRFRWRRPLKVLVSAEPESLEAEPNDRPAQATRFPVPGAANGRIDRPGDADLFRFEARASQAWVIETQAQQRGTPVDTRIEILHADGRPVPRVLLRAVRDSWITFRPVASDAGGARLWQWEEMDLDQYLYMQGEVVRLFLAPQGPDSEWKFYAPAGKRLCYFDTSATAHALDEPCYIVEPHAPGTKLPPNGLPTFTLGYANDDDGMRRLGTDSRLHFAAPADGAYLLRVTDTRGFGGDRFAYRVVAREAKPDFRVSIEGANPNVPAGSGLSFTVKVDRIDGFEGPVRVDLAGAPPGFTISSPVVVEAGQFEAKGSIHAAPDAPKPAAEHASKTKASATASVAGREAKREVNGLGTISLQAPPKVRVFLEPWREEGKPPDPASPLEIEVAPGRLTPALLRIERSNFADRVTFDVENLPFGIIVADIGLNGVLIPEKETERKIFLQCQPWVKPAERLAHARAREVGNPTSRPVLIRVLERRP